LRKPWATKNRSTAGKKVRPTNASTRRVRNRAPRIRWRRSRTSLIRFRVTRKTSRTRRIRFRLMSRKKMMFPDSEELLPKCGRRVSNTANATNTTATMTITTISRRRRRASAGDRVDRAGRSRPSQLGRYRLTFVAPRSSPEEP
jgi:hypothetical protein